MLDDKRDKSSQMTRRDKILDICLGVTFFLGVVLWYVLAERVEAWVLSGLGEVMAVFPMVSNAESNFGYGSRVHVLYTYWAFFAPVFFMICISHEGMAKAIQTASYKKERLFAGLFMLFVIMYFFPFDADSRQGRLFLHAPVVSVFFTGGVVFLEALCFVGCIRYFIALIFDSKEG